jgi:SAM-dependent methyltransferase
MLNSSDISSRFWNLPQSGNLEIEREETFIDDIILKAHTEKEILSHLDGIKTVFDGGAGYGRFSIMLAKKGIHVTHFDISQVMLDKAREIAHREGVTDKITFIHGSLENITQFTDKQFDMVLSFDAPISYTYPNQELVIQNLMRICSKRLIISVYNRAGGGMLYIFNPLHKQPFILKNEASLQKNETNFLPDIKHAFSVLESGLMTNPEETIAEYEQGKAPWPISYSFKPDELSSLLYENGAKTVKLAGPGALLHSIPHEVLINIINDEKSKCEFLDFCYAYDSQPFCEGMGMTNVIARAEMVNE